MGIQKYTTDKPADIELFIALQFKNMYREADSFLRTEEGKKCAIAILLESERFKWILAPLTTPTSDIKNIEKLPFGAVLTIESGNYSMKVVLLEDTEISIAPHTILRVSPLSDELTHAANFDVVINKKYIPFVAQCDQMICAWHEFPILSSSIQEYHGNVSTLATILMSKLADQHTQYETGTIESDEQIESHLLLDYFQEHFIKSNDLDLGYRISTPITDPKDPRIRFQNKLIDQTKIFIDEVNKYTIKEANKSGAQDMEIISVNDIEIKLGFLQTCIFPTKFNKSKLIVIEELLFYFGIDEHSGPYFSIERSKSEVKKRLIDMFCVINERQNIIIQKDNIPVEDVPVNFKVYLPKDFFDTVTVIEIKIGATLYSANLKFKDPPLFRKAFELRLHGGRSE